MTTHTDKQSFIAGWLEAQPEWREAGRLVREHERRARAGEVTPEYVKSLEPHLSKDWVGGFEHSGGYDTDSYISESLHIYELDLLHARGWEEQAEAAWNELQP